MIDMSIEDPKTIKFQLMLSEGEARAIDEWGSANKIRSRAEAIRRLCTVALELDNHANAIDEAIGYLDAQSLMFVERVRELSKRTDSRKNDSIALTAIRASENLFGAVNDLTIDLDAVLGAAVAIRTADTFDKAIEALRENRRRLQEISKALADKRAKARAERERLRYIDFQNASRWIEDAVKLSESEIADADDVVVNAVKAWLAEAKAIKATREQEDLTREQERQRQRDEAEKSK
ncbi:hypothetical protein [Rhizobium binae]|uniref:hypothetical protein n=1 Tax=Rhizobium binae TaxID=1138190 RepID=UPI001C83E1DF|nr:hypothetical protein [Rhizobium binae]MBX4940974.1 hypothetical protein [Rhizobium binae]MBX4942379.1 hypothetical protein [Rhizobium binae]MBX4982100.1 hypothetical protein [Rhizobium binae]